MFGSDNPSGMTSNIYKVFFLFMLFFALYLAYSIVAPFLHTLIFSTVLAVLFWPVHTHSLRLCHGRRNVASLLTVSLIIFCLVIPLSFLMVALIGQGVQSVAALNNWVVNTDFSQMLRSETVDAAFTWLRLKFPSLKVDDVSIQAGILDYTKQFAQNLVSVGTDLFRNFVALVLHFLLMVFTLFYFLRDGSQMILSLKHLSPLRAKQEDYILDSLRRVARGVLMGCLLVAVLQGLAGGIGLSVVGIPAFFWGAMMALASLVPVVGTGLIWVPAVIYLVVAGEWKSALFLSLWCGILVVGIDTLLRPIFMREASRVSTFYIFLSILGGVSTFGMLGVFYGPLILSFIMVMLQIYSEEYAEILNDTEPGDRSCD